MGQQHVAGSRMLLRGLTRVGVACSGLSPGSQEPVLTAQPESHVFQHGGRLVTGRVRRCPCYSETEVKIQSFNLPQLVSNHPRKFCGTALLLEGCGYKPSCV